MAGGERDENYKVVVDEQGQYSILGPGEELQAGWKEAGFSGTNQDCLMYIFNKRTRRG